MQVEPSASNFKLLDAEVAIGNDCRMPIGYDARSAVVDANKSAPTSSGRWPKHGERGLRHHAAFGSPGCYSML